MLFCQRLKELRSEKGISQAELAAQIYVSRSAVAKWENGIGLPSAQSLELIADYFGVEYDSLVSDPDSDAIVTAKNTVISRSKKIIVAAIAVCLIAIAVAIFSVIYFTRDKSTPKDGDSVARIVGVRGEVLDENRHSLWNGTNNDYRLTVGGEYILNVEPLLYGGSTPCTINASDIELVYDKSVLDIYLPKTESAGVRSVYILAVKAICERTEILIRTSIKDPAGEPFTASVFVSAE